MKPLGITPRDGGAWWRHPDPDNEPVKSARAREARHVADEVSVGLDDALCPVADEANECPMCSDGMPGQGFWSDEWGRHCGCCL